MTRHPKYRCVMLSMVMGAFLAAASTTGREGAAQQAVATPRWAELSDKAELLHSPDMVQELKDCGTEPGDFWGWSAAYNLDTSGRTEQLFVIYHCDALGQLGYAYTILSRPTNSGTYVRIGSGSTTETRQIAVSELEVIQGWKVFYSEVTQLADSVRSSICLRNAWNGTSYESRPSTICPR